jgi:hypothetical protein
MTSGESMTGTLDMRGRWWLPAHEDHQVFGTLTWNADDGGTLHLHDELRPVTWLDNVLADGSVQKYRADRGEFQRTYPLILGRVENRAYTLLDSFLLSAREYDIDERTEKVHVNRFLEGAWFDDPDELRVDRVVIDMRHLTGWVNHSGLRVEWPRVDGSDKDVVAIVTAKTLPPFTAEHDGVSPWLTSSWPGLIRLPPRSSRSTARTGRATSSRAIPLEPRLTTAPGGTTCQMRAHTREGGQPL